MKFKNVRTGRVFHHPFSATPIPRWMKESPHDCQHLIDGIHEANQLNRDEIIKNWTASGEWELVRRPGRIGKPFDPVGSRE